MNNSVTRWQMVAKDPGAAARFYSSLFGWKIDTDNSMGYREVTTGTTGIDGGIWPAGPEGHSLVQLFVEVDDVDAQLKRAVSLGGKIIVPTSHLPDGDVMAILLDPNGISIGLYLRKK